MNDKNNRSTEDQIRDELGISGMTPIDDAALPKTSGLAIASLILGILSLLTCGITGLIGLILGIIALVQISKNKETVSGFGLAITGVIISGLTTLMVIPLAALMFPVFSNARESARTSQCLSNIKMIGTGILMYQADNNEIGMPAADWTNNIHPYLKNKDILICPSAETTEPCYAINKRISGKSINNVVDPAGVIMAFESQPGYNQSGGFDLLPIPPRHKTRNTQTGSSGNETGTSDFSLKSLPAHNVVFIDGHAVTIPESYISNPKMWNP